ncbi:hypothetical protein QBC36DRAFT_294393 [Triangularia setosa]|uniref:Uncharacterized protein n=1 Tax=Triangularia setosa TaxID=2587417 RepID=A0AAN6VZ23_9PEZI|nr:hypothetical protein QBC36DRAFT_294393 [Podospora setosa]
MGCPSNAGMANGTKMGELAGRSLVTLWVIVYKKWNVQVAVIAEANAEFHRRTAESRAERAWEIKGRNVLNFELILFIYHLGARKDAILDALDLEAMRHMNEVLEDAKCYFQRDNQNRWPINQKGKNALKGEAMGLIKKAYVDGGYESSLRCSKGGHPCRLAGYRPCNFNYPECIYVDRFGFLRTALTMYSFNKELYKEVHQEDVPEDWEGADCF